jgi:phosphopantetheine adenylyltransferase
MEENNTNFLTSKEALEELVKMANIAVQEKEVDPYAASTTSSNPRRAKIKELKLKIKEASEELTIVRKQEVVTDEDKEKRRKNIVEYVSVISGLEQELKLTIMNRNLSSAFEWKPTPMNRRQRRSFISQQAKLKKHARNRRAKSQDDATDSSGN